MAYQPGDIAKGHVLGADGQWHPIAAPVDRKHPRPVGYFGRYWNRWWKTGVVMGVVTFIAVLLNPYVNATAPQTGHWDWIVGFITGWLGWGTIVNIVVAIPRSRRSR